MPRQRKPPFYRASLLKRHRATKADIEARRAALLAIVEEIQPCTVRQVYYQAVVRGLIDKTEHGYVKIQSQLVFLRRNGLLPYEWITDNTRWQRRPTTYASPMDALEDTAKFYRKSLWAEANCYVEFWLEKDALAGVVNTVTDKFDVPLMVARGYASLSFLHSAAEYINSVGVPTYIYHLGDFDPSGVNAAEKIEEALRELAPEADITFKRLAVTTQQIKKWKLPTRPTKQTDNRAKSFGDISVELDAIAPARLRGIVQVAIEKHLPPRQYAVLKAAEESERDIMARLVDGLEHVNEVP